MAETDTITIEAINPETGYVDTKLAHKIRLKKECNSKKPKTAVQTIEEHMTLSEIENCRRNKGCFLGH